MFRLTAMVLAAALCLPAAQTAKPDPGSVAAAIPIGAMVRIKTLDKQTLEGRLTGFTGDGITVQTGEGPRLATRTVAFAEMRSIQHTNKPLSPLANKLIVIGVVWAVLAGLSAAFGG
jgi:hypothetical protein